MSSQQPYTFNIKSNKTLHLNYLLHLPQDYDDDVNGKWPLILFLHGAGERGSDLNQIKIQGLALVIEEQPDFPFITVAPQCPEHTWWSDHILALNALLDAVVTAYAVDLKHVYLTGMSMGGYGTWHLASVYPERFAAIAPICGGGHWAYGFPERVCALKDVPVWAFHGAKDEKVPLEESEIIVETLKSCGGDVRFTVYPDARHDAWTQTYENPALFEWFLEHSR